MVAVQGGEDLRHLTAQHPEQRQLQRLDDRDLDAGEAGGGRHLQADPSGADHHESRCRTKRALDALGVPDGAEVQHPVEVGARNGQATGDDPVARRSLS